MELYATTTLFETVEFRDQTGALYDPTAVTATVKPPEGAAVTYTYTSEVYPPGQVTRSSLGTFVLKVDLTMGGEYVIKWVGTRASEKVAYETVRKVQPSRIV